MTWSGKWPTKHDALQTVICVKVGDKYPAEYVNRLASMVRRHASVETRVLCLTDDPKGVTECETCDIETDLPGWWAKLVLFKPHSALPGRFVFLDLDTVIVDSIDFLFRYNGAFCILRDFWSPAYGSAVISMVRGFGAPVWTDFRREVLTSGGDQDWITAKVRYADFWQTIYPGRIGSYKADHLVEGPRDFHLVCFHGDPKPHTFTDGWVTQAWR